MTQSAAKYYEGRGGRKNATCRVRLIENPAVEAEKILINGRDYKDYFKSARQQVAVEAPLKVTGLELKNMGVSVKVSGGGVTGQAEAVRHGLALALIRYNEAFRKALKREGFLTRDPRMVERKKYGLKKARRSPQWSKR